MSDDSSNIDGIPIAANSDDRTDGIGFRRWFSKVTSSLEPTTIDKDAPFYRMNGKKRGICLILNYDIFTIPNVQGRNQVGSAATRDHLEKIFGELGFDVKVKNNLTKTQTMSKVKSIATDRDHTDYDCFMMFVMSRGLDDGTLFASDDWFSQEDLFRGFSADLCKTLAGKPKLFFLQSYLPSKNGGEITLRSKDGGRKLQLYPNYADFLITYSTATDNGPCFVQSFAKEIKDNANVADLLSNLTVATKRTEPNPPKSGQAVFTYTAFTLTKRVLFKNDIPTLPEYSGGDCYYKMNHRRRGICFVLSHKEFTIPGCPSRSKEGCTGYTNDLDNVQIFTQLGFEVIIREDLNEEDIMSEVGTVAKGDFLEHDCFVMVIMSHGDDDGVIYAKDKGYNCESLFNMFTDDNCPTLAGKPRLFFIQACKGKKLDPGTPMYVLEHTPAMSLEEGEGSTLDTLPGSIGPMTTGKIPIQRDFLVAYSTLPGYFAFKNDAKGSWFIQALAEKLESSKDHNLLTILSFVNGKVAIDFQSKTKSPLDIYDKKKIVPYVTTRLTKLVKFS